MKLRKRVLSDFGCLFANPAPIQAQGFSDTAMSCAGLFQSVQVFSHTNIEIIWVNKTQHSAYFSIYDPNLATIIAPKAVSSRTKNKTDQS